jgi:PAS domain S-box-containing protein
LSVVLSTAAVDYFLLPPRFSFYVGNPADAVDLLLFAPLASICVVLIAEIRRSAVKREQAEQTLQTTEGTLQTSKDRLQLGLDAAQLGWWQYDTLRRVVSGDTRFKEIFDVSGDDIPVEDIVMKRVHRDDAEWVWADLQAAFDRADEKPYTHEYRVRRSNGEVRWVETHALPYFEGVGAERRAAGNVVSVADISKEREEKEHLLMREVNHRAKNMLSVVDSIAHQTAARNPEDFIERLSERVQALSANQDLLVRSEWQGVDVEI